MDGLFIEGWRARFRGQEGIPEGQEPPEWAGWLCEALDHFTELLRQAQGSKVGELLPIMAKEIAKLVPVFQQAVFAAASALRQIDCRPPEQLHMRLAEVPALPGNEAWERLAEVHRALMRVRAIPAEDHSPPADDPPQPYPLTDTEQAVYDIIKAQPPGKGIIGKQIISALRGEKTPIEIGQSTLTRHIIPKLKQRYGVKNRRGVGYYIESS